MCKNDGSAGHCVLPNFYGQDSTFARQLRWLANARATISCADNLAQVDDHCGFSFPWDPFQFLFVNNVDYHDVSANVCSSNGRKADFSLSQIHRTLDELSPYQPHR